MTNRHIMTIRSKDRIGIVSAVTTCLADNSGFINELAQFGTPSSEQFYSRIEFTINPHLLGQLKESLAPVINKFGMSLNIVPAKQRTRTLVMVSTADHCLNDILYRQRTGVLNIEIPAIISNHQSLKPIADNAGIPFHHIPVNTQNKKDAEDQLRDIIAKSNIELVVLARYMQILTAQMCNDFAGSIINIHHSFLPSFVGAKPYHRAFERGVKLIGATAHYVTSDLDEGPIIEQMVKRVDHTMEPEELVAIGRDIEAQTLAQAIKVHAEHRSFTNGNKTVVLP